MNCCQHHLMGDPDTDIKFPHEPKTVPFKGEEITICQCGMVWARMIADPTKRWRALGSLLRFYDFS